MKGKKILHARIQKAIIILLSGLFLFSCTDFFSTSLFPWAARDPGSFIPEVTLDNLEELKQLFEDDPEASLALLKKIRDAAKAQGLSEDEINQLLAGALGTAVNSAGLGQAVLGAVGSMSNFGDMSDEEVREALFGSIANLSNLEETSSILSDMLPEPGTPPAFSQEFRDFTDSASADDLAMAAVVLLLGAAVEVAEGDFNQFLDDPVSIWNTIPNPTREMAQAMAVISALDGREDELSEGSALANILEHLNLINRT